MHLVVLLALVLGAPPPLLGAPLLRFSAPPRVEGVRGKLGVEMAPSPSSSSSAPDSRRAPHPSLAGRQAGRWRGVASRVTSRLLSLQTAERSLGRTRTCPPPIPVSESLPAPPLEPRHQPLPSRRRMGPQVELLGVTQGSPGARSFAEDWGWGGDLRRDRRWKAIEGGIPLFLHPRPAPALSRLSTFELVPWIRFPGSVPACWDPPGLAFLISRIWVPRGPPPSHHIPSPSFSAAVGASAPPFPS